MRRSQYCYVHSFGKKSQLSIWRRPETHLIISILAGILVTWIAFYFGPSQEKQDQTLLKQDRAEQKLDALLKRFGDRLSPETLLARYPLGYIIFELAYTNRVFPYEDRIISKYKLNWKVVGFTKVTSKAIELRLPDIISADGKVGVTNVLTGGPKRVGNLGGAMVRDLLVLGEILEIRDTGIVFLVGFQKGP